MKLEDISAAIAAIDLDPALCSALKAQLKTVAPNFSALLSRPEPKPLIAFPEAATITAAQCSLFDNWIEHGGKRPRRGQPGHHKDRFKITVEVWTRPTKGLDLNRHTSAFLGTAHLWTGEEILKRASLTRKSFRLPKALTNDFREWLVAQASKMGNARLGLIYTRDGKAIRYHDNTCVLVEDEAELEERAIGRLLISGPRGEFVFEAFKTTTSKGNPLPKNCFAHSRMAVEPALAEAWDATLIER